MKNKPLLFFMAFILCSCSHKNSEKSAITTSSDNQHYRNELFDLEVEKPSGWYSQNVTEMIALQRLGGKLVSGQDKNLQAMAEAAVASTLPIFGFFEFPLGTPGKLNPSLISNAENIALYPGIKSGCDYLSHVKEIMGKSQLTMKFNETCNEQILSGNKFGYYEVTIENGGMKIFQRYYACRKDSHAIGFVETYFDESSKQKVDQILNNIKINCDK